jgi:lysozyme family protein
MNYEEILARVLAGENEEAIVKEFTDNMNEALKAKRAQEEEAAAAAKCAEVEQKKAQVTDAMAALLNEYVMLCGEENPGVTAGDVRELFDSVMELVPLFKNLSVQISTPKTRAKSKKVKIGNTPEDVFADFFKSLGI